MIRIHRLEFLKYLTPFWVALGVFPTFAQTTSFLPARDIKAAEVDYDNEIDAKLKVLRQTLKDGPDTFPDGARGYSVQDKFEIGALPVVGDREKDSEILLGSHACASSLVAVAEAGPAAGSFLISNDRGIITAYPFTLLDVLKGNVRRGKTMTAIQFGGTLQENGMTLRVAPTSHQTIKAGGQYLLFFYKNPQYPSNSYLLLGYSYDKVNGDMIAPSPRKSDEIISNPIHAESIEAFAARMEKAMAVVKAKGFCN